MKRERSKHLLAEVHSKQSENHVSRQYPTRCLSRKPPITHRRPASMLTLTLGAPAEGIGYEKRTAVRCLIVRDGQICIIYVKKGI